ncbi:hypothetical protein YN1_4910 [Nanoarchaeota archaeon]
MNQLKFNIFKALKDSFIFYYKNFFQIILIYLIFFISNLLISILVKVNLNIYNITFNYSFLYYLLILFIINILIYPFFRTAIYIYFEEKNIKDSFRKSIKYYFGMILLYLFNIFIFSIIIISLSFISLLISILISFYFNTSIGLSVYIIMFIILSIISLIITNKFFLSSPIFVFNKNRVYESLRISWKNINIKEAAKILIAQLIIYSLALILLIYQEVSNYHLIIRILLIFISSFLLIPIGNLFSIYVYQQYKENYK